MKIKTMLLFAILIGGFYNLQAQNWNEIIKATASDAAQDQLFGASVNISGNTAVVGSIGSFLDSGAVYIFELNNGMWLETAKITASDAAAGDAFGISVAISGNIVVVGASGNEDAGTSSGSAYIFELNSGIWSETAKITASDAAAGDEFGCSIDVSGNKVVVGSLNNDDAGNNSGSAYIFGLNSGTWSETVKITASDAATDDKFAVSVAISGDKVIVGAFGDAVGASGSAYIFELNSGTWSETAILTASDAAADDFFGWDVDVSANRVIVGADGNDDAGSNSGSAYIFELTSGTWSETVKITASDATLGDGFGASVSISGDKAVVGAGGNDDAGSNSGSVYIFGLNSGTWSETEKLTASDADVDDSFGASVAISVDKVIVGAFHEGLFTGAAYIFEQCLTTGTDVQTVCGSYLFNGITYTSNNTTAKDTLTNAAGCDSIVTLNLTINSVDVSTFVSGFVITANQAGATYQWLDCDNGNAIISGANNQSYTVTANGNYAIEVTVGACLDTSACVNVSTVGVNENNLTSNINIYPNPTNGYFTIELETINNAKILIIDVTGKEVYSLSNITKKQTHISLSEFSKAIYFIKIQEGDNYQTRKLILK